MNFIEAIQTYSGQPITSQLLLDLLKEYRRPLDKIEELINQKKLIRVKRGIYVAGPALKISQPEPLLLANHLAGPSYVSLQTALSYWRLIPEKVYEISSMTTSRSKTYHTPIGRYTYTHLPLPYYAFGQRQAELAEKQVALVASAEKAICDTIIATSGLRLRSQDQTRKWLLENMRMDIQVLRTLHLNIIREWLKNAPKIDSLQLLIETMENL